MASIGKIFLIKFLAGCGVTSRRKAFDLIKSGRVTVNDEVVKTPFYEVQESDVVSFDGKVVMLEPHVYILLNKPKDFLSTCADCRGRKNVLDLIEGATDLRVYPVGRLDRMSTGLILITNDGDLAQKLSHPSSNVFKEYKVTLDKPLLEEDFLKLKEGLMLEDGFIKVDVASFPDDTNKKQTVLTIHSGRNRIIRRMFKHLRYEVEKLDRIKYAGLTKRHLPLGKWRFLTDEEVARLHTAGS